MPVLPHLPESGDGRAEAIHHRCKATARTTTKTRHIGRMSLGLCGLRTAARRDPRLRSAHRAGAATPRARRPLETTHDHRGVGQLCNGRTTSMLRIHPSRHRPPQVPNASGWTGSRPSTRRCRGAPEVSGHAALPACLSRTVAGEAIPQDGTRHHDRPGGPGRCAFPTGN